MFRNVSLILETSKSKSTVLIFYELFKILKKENHLIKILYETSVLVDFIYATCNFIYNQLDNYFLFLNYNQIEYFEFGFIC